MTFTRNRFGDYICGDVAIVAPRFTGKWIITMRGEPQRREATLGKAIDFCNCLTSSRKVNRHYATPRNTP